MTIAEQINADMKQAMLAKEKDKLAAIRSIKSELLKEATKGGGDGSVSDEAALKIIQKLHKQRTESAQLYREQNRDDLAQEEELQAEVLESYLPEQMNEEEVKAVLEKVKADTGASSMADMGAFMGAAMKELQGKADGKLISKVARELLA